MSRRMSEIKRLLTEIRNPGEDYTFAQNPFECVQFPNEVEMPSRKLEIRTRSGNPTAEMGWWLRRWQQRRWL